MNANLAGEISDLFKAKLAEYLVGTRPPYKRAWIEKMFGEAVLLAAEFVEKKIALAVKGEHARAVELSRALREISEDAWDVDMVAIAKTADKALKMFGYGEDEK